MKKVSIIMPTYNSERTIAKSLGSIRNQTYPQEDIEILIIDGGSTDKTLEIAQRYGGKIVSNIRKLPEVAKEIGLQTVKGEYAMYLDSDEILQNKNCLKDRMACLEKNSEIKNIVSSGMISEPDAKGIIKYLNYMGDPFSQFVYGYNGNKREKDLKRNYTFKEDVSSYVFTFERGQRLPLFDAAGNMFEVKFARELYTKAKNKSNFAANIFENTACVSRCVLMLKDDFVIHTPTISTSIYLKKLKWRVKNNIFPKQGEGVGFSSRIETSPQLLRRQYLYAFYCSTAIGPILKSLILAIENKNWFFCLHFIFCEYIMVQIIKYKFIKIFHLKIKHEETYGK